MLCCQKAFKNLRISTLRKSFYVNFCCQNAFKIIQNLLQNFWTWFWSPPLLNNVKKTADLAKEGTPYNVEPRISLFQASILLLSTFHIQTNRSVEFCKQLCIRHFRFSWVLCTIVRSDIFFFRDLGPRALRRRGQDDWVISGGRILNLWISNWLLLPFLVIFGSDNRLNNLKLLMNVQ